MSIHVQLERFEGPLGLLLHLIREQEMDIFNINIHEITRQYLEYIKAMRRLDLEVAGEFVAMAATLLHIKSRLLLPQYNEEGEEIQEDPRKELVQKLLEYQKVKELSAELYKLPVLGRDVYPRGERAHIEAVEESELILEENPLFSLIAAYRFALKNMKKTVHKVAGELQSIASRIIEMKDLLVLGKRVVFRELITAKENVSSQVLVTFLSLLELAKMGFVSLFQTEAFADIHIETKQSIDRDVVSRVENYDAVNATAKAEEILQEAQLALEEPVAQFEGEEAPVVEAAYADAATDEDIEAEERRLLGEEAVIMDEPSPALMAEAEVVQAPAPAESSETVSEAPANPEMPLPEAAAPVELPVEELSVAQQLETIALPVVEEAEEELCVAQPLETIAMPSVQEPVEAAYTDPQPSVAKLKSDIAFLTTPDPAKVKLDNAVSRALSAFDAFKDDPEVEA